MKPLSLYELNSLIKELIYTSFVDTYWITAELSEVRVSAKGHCFIELIEKQQHGSTPMAKAHAVIMNNLYPLLKMDFEETTGQRFSVGLKVQLKVEISFSEIYGYSLIVRDIDPTYTMGSLAQLRKEIIDRLTRDGIVDMNKQLSLPRPLQRIAVVSSATAAGYGDFCNQLDNNSRNFYFNHKLFAATMQGTETAASIIEALDTIASQAEQWDAVVIIRGGGAVSDFAGFENYELAACCAQFPLPIITGIGHERDTTVIDLVANTHLKTPTAVAAFLIDHITKEADKIDFLETAIINYSINTIKANKRQLDHYLNILNNTTKFYCKRQTDKLSLMYEKMLHRLTLFIRLQQQHLAETQKINEVALKQLQNNKLHLENMERALSLYDPIKILNLGYSITRSGNRVVKDASQIKEGEVLTTTFANGQAASIVKSTNTRNI